MNQYTTSNLPDTAYCQNCSDDSKCIQKMDAECVIYHRDDLKPSRLLCMGMPNKSSVEAILERIDTFMCNINGLQTPIVAIDTASINVTTFGTLGHNIQADAIISPNANNILSIQSNGLYATPVVSTDGNNGLSLHANGLYAIAPTGYTASNGLTQSPTNNFKLGGTLTADTNIDLQTFLLSLTSPFNNAVFSPNALASTLTLTKSGGYINSPVQSAAYNALTFTDPVFAGSGSHYTGTFNNLIWSVSSGTTLNPSVSYSASEGYVQYVAPFNTTGGNIASFTAQGNFAGIGSLDKFIGFRAKAPVPYSGGYSGTLTSAIGIQIDDQKMLMPGNITDATAINQVGTGDKNVFNGVFQLPAANVSIGTATLVGGTKTVATTAVKTGAHIFLSRNTPGGTTGDLSAPVASIVNNTSFVINSTSGTETSTVNFWVINI